ncbi:MAG TPA: zinc-dependent alcohol dehydrogenase, partial [Gemmatimonadaceae bacterium]|nr:zinc-dependent alcohol dehydrogenase [Gemmatimonadaceae bacterium]
HLMHGVVPTMEKGDIIGHEFMGEIIEVGRDVTNLALGDRVVVPFPIACGHCSSCDAGMTSLCENSNPNSSIAETLMGHAPCGIYGYGHMTGGFSGGQAEYARVPFADFGPLKVPEQVTDEQALFLSDILPTGYMGAEQCNIQPGQTVAVWGCGPVGQFAIASAYLLGASRVIAIDNVPYRLRMAREKAGAITLNYDEIDNVPAALRELTGGRGPDACIDCVGMEAQGHGALYALDRAKQLTKMQTDVPYALRQAIMSCRNGGVVSIVGAYVGIVDGFPIGSLMNRSIRIVTGQCHVHRYMKPLLELIQAGKLDPTFVITHRMHLADAPRGYHIFDNKLENCEKVVLKVS